MTSLSERIAQTKRLQAAVRAGEGPHEAASGPPGAVGLSVEGEAASRPPDELQSDFEALLQVVGRHFQYDTDDFAAMRGLLADKSAAGVAELKRTLHEWRLELVAQGLTDQVDDATAQRCWHALGSSASAATAVVSPSSLHSSPRATPAF